MLRRSTLAPAMPVATSTPAAAPGRGVRALVIANAVGAAVSMAAAVVGLVSPELALPGSTGPTGPLVDVYAQAYAARALPLGAVLLYHLQAGRSSRSLTPLLLVAGMAQVADAAIGLSSANPGMAVGGTLLAALHLGLAAHLTRTRRP